MRALSLALALLLCRPALAADGLFVWNDPQAMAVKLATLSPRDPAEATGLRVLLPLRAISVTMTAVASDGGAIGICHELQDGNEGGLELLGFDPRGRQTWRLGWGEVVEAMAATAGPGVAPGAGHRVFLSCANGGATGRAGITAFDIGVARTEFGDEVVVRLHLDRRGRAVAGEMRAPGARSGLKLGRNPSDRMERTAEGLVVMDPEAQLVFPEGGEGRVLYGSRPIRWQGEAAVSGHDFAWWLPPRP
jgi:hypothetical protein